MPYHTDQTPIYMSCRSQQTPLGADQNRQHFPKLSHQSPCTTRIVLGGMPFRLQLMSRFSAHAVNSRTELL